MPDDFDIKIDGIDEVNKALYAYSQQLGDRVMLKSLREGSKVVLREVRRLAPKGRTGRLRKGIVVRSSRIHSARRSRSTLGVYMTLRKGSGRADPKDAFYGRFVNDGWNTKGRRAISTYDAQQVKKIFGKRSGRKTMRGKTNVAGREFFDRGFKKKRIAATNLIIKLILRGSEIVKFKTGLK